MNHAFCVCIIISRFGLDGDDEKLKSRAARFGTEPSSNANSLKSNEKMKQRAERYVTPGPFPN